MKLTKSKSVTKLGISSVRLKRVQRNVGSLVHCQNDILHQYERMKGTHELGRSVPGTLHQQIYGAHRYAGRNTQIDGATGSEDEHSPCGDKEDFTARDSPTQGVNGVKKENHIEC